MLVFDKKKSWLSLVFSVRGSALLRIRYRLLSVFLLSVAFTYVQETGHIHSPVNLAAFSLIGLALGIFLGFRNNTSYDRFWEGRRLWGQLVNTSRSLCRDTLNFLALTDEHRPSEAAISALGSAEKSQIYRLIAFSHALRMSLRENMQLESIQHFLDEPTLQRIAEHRNVPNAILLELGVGYADLAKTGQLSELRLIELSRHVTELSNVQGGCERIKNTPFPHSYSILMHQIVALYVFALPFGLVDTLHLWTPVVVMLVAYTFLGLDALGDELEDPFGDDLNDLPLDTLCRTIEVNLRQMLGEREVPPLMAPKDGLLT